MTIQEEIPQQNPFEDQRKQALELYEKMVKECHHCSSFIQRAIESYNPDLQAQLSAKEQEIASLERGIAGYSKEVSELQKIASDQEITDLKTCVDNFSDMYQEKCIELASVRAENERLKEDNFKSLVFISDQGLILGDLRKRCEDLEHGLKWSLDNLNNYDKPSDENLKMYDFCVNLLNQIKS